MALSFALSTAHAMLDAITAKIDAGSGAAKLRIYSGVSPSRADDSITSQVLLAELTLSDPSAPAAANKSLALSTITEDSSADASGVASFFRIVDSSSNTILQGAVSETGQGGDLEMNSATITVGGPVQITSASFGLV